MKKSIKLVRHALQGVCCAALLAGPMAYADSGDIDFAGFASFVYAKTVTDDDEKGDFSGISNEGEYRDFNKLGLRMSTDLKDNLVFTAQVLAEGENDYNPTFDWIFATYSFNYEWSLTAGKYRVPVFMYSDYLDTSYAYQWVAPPVTVYNQNQTPFKSMEGLKLRYLTDLGGDWTSELLIWGGKSQDRFKEPSINVDADLILEDAFGVAWTVDREWLSLRAFYLDSDSSLDITSNPFMADLINGTYGGEIVAQVTETPVGTLPALVALEANLSLALGQDVNLIDDMLWEKDHSKFYGFGTSIDFGGLYIPFMAAEYTRIQVDSNLVVPELDSWYLMVGTRLPGRVTLSLTYGQDRDEAVDGPYKQLDKYVALTGDPDLALYQGAIKAIVEEQQNYEVNMTTLGARWDFHRQASAKFEYLVYEWDINDRGSETPNAIRLGLDLVF